MVITVAGQQFSNDLNREVMTEAKTSGGGIMASNAAGTLRAIKAAHGLTSIRSPIRLDQFYLLNGQRSLPRR